MNKVTALVVSIIAFVGIACSAVGTLTPEPTETLITNTPKATLTAIVTLTPTQEATEVATAGTVEVTLTPTVEPWLLTPTPIVQPTATHMVEIQSPENTEESDEFIEVTAPLVNVRSGASIYADVIEQLPNLTVRKVYAIYYNYTTGEVWAQINPTDETPAKWVNVEPQLCRDEGGARINCTEFRP